MNNSVYYYFVETNILVGRVTADLQTNLFALIVTAEST